MGNYVRNHFIDAPEGKCVKVTAPDATGFFNYRGYWFPTTSADYQLRPVAPNVFISPINRMMLSYAFGTTFDFYEDRQLSVDIEFLDDCTQAYGDVTVLTPEHSAYFWSGTRGEASISYTGTAARFIVDFVNVTAGDDSVVTSLTLTGSRNLNSDGILFSFTVPTVNWNGLLYKLGFTLAPHPSTSGSSEDIIIRNNPKRYSGLGGIVKLDPEIVRSTRGETYSIKISIPFDKCFKFRTEAVCYGCHVYAVQAATNFDNENLLTYTSPEKENEFRVSVDGGHTPVYFRGSYEAISCGTFSPLDIAHEERRPLILDNSESSVAIVAPSFDGLVWPSGNDLVIAYTKTGAAGPRININRIAPNYSVYPYILWNQFDVVLDEGAALLYTDWDEGQYQLEISTTAPEVNFFTQPFQIIGTGP